MNAQRFLSLCGFIVWEGVGRGEGERGEGERRGAERRGEERRGER
jgi:hypothetical protein